MNFTQIILEEPKLQQFAVYVPNLCFNSFL